ncbi:glycosyltransferase [Amorphus orientalis]|uniref:Cellulose synthase (UDP-forming) n=1 Tax=Amorphus orientalis TaxID=649198 RepID=A0AAE3VM99_9HYPH|nr:glycosyltransferase [Amorphus orientalis]MDQ0314557.1 cellulose synthase (UDP-forming) [Amorphus orientalis]
MIYLSAFQSSLLHLALVAGVVLLLPSVFNRETNLHRTIVFATAGLLAMRYVWWRATETLAPFGLTWDCLASWSFFALEAGAVLSSLSAFTLLSRVRHRQAEADANAGWWAPGRPPRVAVLIATYNEDRDVLERTLAGAAALNHPVVEILVLDDGRRPWLTEFAARFGARHVTRPDNAHAKAGNINHTLAALAERAERPDFVAVLDADFVPHRNFLERTLALFHEPDIGLVQTPQHFFNADPIQHNLGLSRSYPDEQRFFFDHLQPSRDAWGIAFCCGTSSVMRFEALKRIGFFPTDSITEDFLVTIALQNAGFRTVYLDEALTEGLAPEGLKEYITQRARWCLGLMQIARGKLGPLSRNRLRLRDRWSLIDSVLYWTTTFTFRLAALTFPLLYWFFNVTVVNATVPDVISYFGTYFLFVIAALNFVSGGLVVPLVNDVSQMLGAIPITRAAYTGLLKPHGHAFKVTAKGGDRTRTIVQWGLMRPFAILFALTVLGLMVGLFSWRYAFDDAGDGKVVILFWTFYNLIVLALTMFACVELPRAERHYVDVPERVTVRFGEGAATRRAWMRGLATDGMRLRGATAPAGTDLVVSIGEVGEVAATVVKSEDDGAILRLLPDETQREAIMNRLYAAGNAPGVTQTRLPGILPDFLIRLTSGRP